MTPAPPHAPSPARSRTAQLIEDAAARLSQFQNPNLDAETLFRGVSGLSRADVLARARDVVPRDVAARFEAAVERRERHEPIQYILGTAAFWRDEFIVNPAVLIPRPETEILVEAVAKRLRGHPEPHLLDLGTGSGCIALSLLRETPAADAVAIDISAPALQVARENAQRLGFHSRIDFRISHWFDSIPPGESFDAIVSNPPYVARSEEAALPRDVREFEPSLALFADPRDDISSYRTIVDGMANRLRPQGFLALEVGLGQADRVEQLIREAGLDTTEILNDLAGIPRVVLGRRG